MICALCLLLCLFGLDAVAQDMSSGIEEVTLEEALDILKNREGYSFILKTDDIDLKKKVKVNLADANHETLMKSIFAGQDIIILSVVSRVI